MSQPNSHWNYRVCVQREPDIVDKSEWVYTYSIRDVYYRDGVPTGYGADPQPAVGETMSGVLEDLKLMLMAFKKPVLYIASDGHIHMEDPDGDWELVGVPVQLRGEIEEAESQQSDISDALACSTNTAAAGFSPTQQMQDQMKEMQAHFNKIEEERQRILIQKQKEFQEALMRQATPQVKANRPEDRKKAGLLNDLLKKYPF